MPWAWKILWIVACVSISWWAMMIVHELGHMLAAWLTGGRVVGWELKPWAISRTDVAPNPSPLAVAWGGPLLGAVAPQVLAAAASVARLRVAPLAWFFAGFCLIANGAYLAFGSLGRVGDAGQLLRHSAAAWQLWAFGLVAMAAGLLVWHRLSEQYAWRTALARIDRRRATTACVFAAALFIGMAVWG